MKIELRELARVRPYDRNPRQNDSAIPAVAESIREFGFRKPIVVDADGVIVCGHTCYFAAQFLGLEKVPVHVADDLSPEQIKAYRIADNKLGELAEWDWDLLPIELADLSAADYDLDVLGFSREQMAKLLAPPVPAPLADPNFVPAPPDEPISKPGDIWNLGNHRLICGDSSKFRDIERLLAGAPVHLVNMDPPYNVKVEPRSNNAIAAGTGKHHAAMDAARDPSKAKATTAKLRAKDRPLKNDFVSEPVFQRLLLAWFGNASRVLLPGRSFYIWGGYANCANYPQALKLAKLQFSQSIIWVKHNPVLTRKDFMGDHEWCFYGWKEGGAHEFYGPQNVRDVWEVKKVNSQDMVHLTEKPIELAVRAMEYSSLPGENVLDLFGGSGSTLIAAETCGRKAFLVELDPLYCDVIVDRWEKLTGRKAEREQPAAA